MKPNLTENLDTDADVPEYGSAQTKSKHCWNLHSHAFSMANSCSLGLGMYYSTLYCDSITVIHFVLVLHNYDTGFDNVLHIIIQENEYYMYSKTFLCAVESDPVLLMKVFELGKRT